MPTLTGVHHVALTVTDVERSVPWYERVLGFTTVGRRDDGAGGLREVFLRGPGAGLALTLVQHTDVKRASFNERRPGLAHLSFAVPDEAGLRQWTERLTECGVLFAPVDDGGTAKGRSVIALRDPDGIQLVLWVDSRGCGA